MDKTAIKKFAVDARRSLIESIKLKAASLGISEKGIAPKLAISTPEIEYYKDELNGITGKDIEKRQKLVAELNQRAQKNDLATAFHDLVEEVAYTWFNRIIAIRFMEVNDYLPSRTRVLSSTENRNEPDIMVHALDVADDLGGFSPAEQDLINRALDTEQPTDLDAEYQMLFIKQANALNKNLPYLFETTNDYAELLFTPNYHDGVIQHLITDVSADDFNVAVGGQVEIIGWLYQYYNTEPHDQVVNITGGPVKKADIPAVTQLFTTDWVVKYMVDNSLGKYWLERHPDSNLKDHLAFLLPSKLELIGDSDSVEDLKIIDNAMGSGHILVYAFDVLMQIYSEQGYSSRDAATLILQKNLFGLEIDKRAYQLAYFALMMKARQFNRRALRTGNVEPNVFVFEDTDDISEEFMAQVPAASRDDLGDIVGRFSNARELGSIIHFDGQKKYDFAELRHAVETVQVDDLDIFGFQAMQEKLRRVLKIAEVLCDYYNVVVTNPPYMNKMDSALKKYVKKYYADYSGDLFAIFIFNNSNLTKRGGYSAFMTPFVWMFIKTYEKLRKYLVENKKIDSLIQMEYSAFEEATVPINTFVLKNVQTEELGTYLKLSAFKGGMDVQKDRVLEAIANPDIDYLYRTNQANFAKIPGMPIAYWASAKVLRSFSNVSLGSVGKTRVGMATASNDKFIRKWYEVDQTNISYHSKSRSLAQLTQRKWFPYDKGGEFRKWYGNNSYVVDWGNDGKEIRSFTDGNGKVRSHNYNLDLIFRPGFTWSALTSGNFSARKTSFGHLFGSGGHKGFVENDKLNFVLGLLNSTITQYLLQVISQTLNFESGNIAKIPLNVTDSANHNSIDNLVNQNTNNSRWDWDSFETSWDFTRHPLLSHIADDKRNEVDGKLKSAFSLWRNEAQERFDQLKSNEEELNRIFIDLYGLNDELTPEVADKDVSVRLADEVRDIKSFLSYFVGVVFGRYSLDVEGLAFAGGEWDKSKYQSFVPNEDNLLLLNDADYFGDSRDIINRLRSFLTVTFGAESVDENLSYIASVVGKKADSDEMAIRRYFVEDFFKDHKKIYQKRPIYWEFTSGRHNGFKALMYLHRYESNELAMVRTNYLHPLQGQYEARIDQLTQLANNEAVASQKKRYEKNLKHLEQQVSEIRKYDPLIQHIANQKIELDLDDGVVVNYDKLQDGNAILSKLK
ncbi:BREX-1 system adenine-specific DNA-methyltransferase PglX [Levilactobacillus wangkuiensis]|uniref:BREX-1 system adenine-specific DNA-methyltransferase PglX n=1 Tax=Levilactobacillus wangkuiensis TaxID=2799566 RepID=UPI001940CE5E|nr:BREX-1 system adenine-specific DNA-methyltransferase PglX [Levilactobacillus wangkuiensis]